MESSQVAVETLLAQRGWVHALARTLVEDEHRADDVEQEAWLAALRRPPREGGSLRAWFASVVRSRVRDEHRVDVRRGRREIEAARPEATPSAADVASSTEIHRRLVTVLMALEEPYRSAVILRYFEDLPPREIAARTGVPVETARTRVKRGIERLRERLDADHGGDRRAWCLLVTPLGGSRASASAFGGGIVATKKTAVLAAIVLLALGAGAIVWVSRPGDASSRVTAESEVSAMDPADEKPRERPGRARPQEEVAKSKMPPDPSSPSKSDRPSVAVVDAVTREPLRDAVILVVEGGGRTSW